MVRAIEVHKPHVVADGVALDGQLHLRFACVSRVAENASFVDGCADEVDGVPNHQLFKKVRQVDAVIDATGSSKGFVILIPYPIIPRAREAIPSGHREVIERVSGFVGELSESRRMLVGWSIGGLGGQDISP
jgi:hypothetical protein